ncbi:MAG: S-layer homology domain-containing protein [Oscillibacter sp.]|nr:S-layer homology domain-containing protein [Oscillibacter sp.]
MKHLRTLIALLAVFSLMSGFVPAKALELTAGTATSESIEDPEGDAAAIGETAVEEGTASGNTDENTGEEDDVMGTLSGESVLDTSPDENAPASEGENETPADNTGENEPPADTGELEPPADTGELEPPVDTGENEPPADTGENETPTDTGELEPPVDTGENEPPVTPSPLPFTDVDRDNWCFPYVLYAYEHDLVRGVSETAFNPTGVMTRAAFVTVLYRLSATLEGADMSAGTAAFTDIGDINAEFQSAILWAVAHGIVTGKNEETFAPRENVSRQQMCAILVRYLRDYLRYDLSAYAGETSFADSDSISAYAKEAVSMMGAMDIISGREADGVTIFDPAGSASRAAVVKVLSIAVQRMPDLQKLPESEPEPDTGESTDTGDSNTGDSDTNSDTGDTKKSSGGGSGSSGGSSSGSGSGSSGGGGGSVTPVVPAREPENAAEIFGYIDELIAAYEANPPAGSYISSSMEILIKGLREMREARSQGTIVDADYFKSHYQADLDELLRKYNTATIQESLDLANYARSLVSSTSKLKEIAKYFGVMDMLGM